MWDVDCAWWRASKLTKERWEALGYNSSVAGRSRHSIRQIVALPKCQCAAVLRTHSTLRKCFELRRVSEKCLRQELDRRAETILSLWGPKSTQAMDTRTPNVHLENLREADDPGTFMRTWL